MLFPDAFDTVLTELFGFHHNDIRLSSSAKHQVSIATHSLPIHSQAVPELCHSVHSPSSPSYDEKYAIGVTKGFDKALDEEHLQETPSSDIGPLTIVVRDLTLSQECQTRPLLSPRRSLAALSGSSHSSATKSIQASEKTLGGLESDKESQGNVRTTSQPPVQRHNEPPVGDCETKGSPKSDVTSNRRQNSISQSEAFLHQNSNTDCVDESAIDDDSESEAFLHQNSNTDCVDETGKRSSIDEETFFQRTDNNSKLTSRRSLITMMVVEMDNRGGVGNVASRSISTLPFRTSHPAPPTLAVSPNDSDDAPLIMKRDNGWSPLKPIIEVPRSAPWPISKNASRWCEAVLSPRTTRRYMLATEMTNSVRWNMLWERGQKSATANAVLKRRHTSHDVANLKQYPEIARTTTRKDGFIDALYLAYHTGDDYNTRGW
ncbi:hypothetical protein CTAM01_16884 [Colletotrichum tamarilloi]|uniref:DUF3295 domain-containing protein n=1 Tax=Colletotrichum tamarilloi TaxID=1209934 RepID=A0ABQ9QHA4_9PEZI|nr:uncharacterized protein CTAM01_16884 [Colletotrichum tamarilloi]KAK1470248.1 hypothetical protein CTAM01_16884 [Colletotrichum tamarilloi]